MFSLEEFKLKFEKGIYQLQDDEYLRDNLPYCKKCDGARFHIIEYDNKIFVMRSRCDCQERVIQNRKACARALNIQNKMFWLQKNSGLSERFFNVSFENSKIIDSNEEVYSKCKLYVQNAKEVIKQNIGLYLYGPTSTGKTHLTACMINALIQMGYSCYHTTLFEYMNLTRKPLFSIKTIDFLFIDDLGKEFLGRDANANISKLQEQTLFRIIDTRYKCGKPLIVSSNYTISELRTFLKLDKAIVDRIDEMSTRILKLEGSNFRKNNREQINLKAKELGI